MKRRILSLLCAAAILMGMVTIPAFADEAEGNLQDKVNDYTSGVITLSEDAENLTVEANTYIDLNGHTIAGVTVADGVSLYVSDSQTDDYTVADGVCGAVTGITGSVQAAEGYLAITEDEAVSFHRVDLAIKSMSLRPGNAGVYYTSSFAADEIVAAKVESYGVALSVAAEPTAENLETLCGYSVLYNFGAGEKSGTLLTGIMDAANTAEENAANAAMDIYGRAYIKTEDGYTFGATVVRDLQEQVEAIDAIFDALNETQKSGILEMYQAYKAAMADWNIPNLRGNQLGDTVITVPVQTENGVVTETVTVEKDGVSVTIPFGALVEKAELTLNVTKKAQSDSGIEAAADQQLLPFDVHVDGVSSENTAPLTVYLGKVMPENLNMGNYSIYHVEADGTKEMALVANEDAFTAHNQYKYTLDGELTLHMATFSEVAAVADNQAKWEGKVDHSWYTKNPDAEVFEIRNADQLWSFSQIVGGMTQDTEGKLIKDDEGNVIQDHFDGKTIKLLSDIDLNDAEKNNQSWIFYPIGYWNNQYTYENFRGVADVSSGFYSFNGTFDGNGNTISDFYQNTWEMVGDYNDGYAANSNYYRDGMGLFGKVYGGTIKNLIVKNFQCDSEHGTSGVIAAYADSQANKPAVFENISIFDCNPRVYNIGNGGIVGCAGWYARNETDIENTPITFRNISVDQSNKISALWDATGTSAGGILGQYYPDSNCGIHFENCHTAAVIEVNNDCCSNYHYYWYRYSGMLMGSIRRNTKDENGNTVADTTGITAKNCTYTYGNWNEYWYCELVKNTIASYTHDHQFGRLTSIDDLSRITNDGGQTWLQEGNFALLDENRNCIDCYHIFKNSEGNLYRHYHNVEDETNPNIYETFDLNGDGELNDLKEDRQRYYIPFGQLFTGDGMGVKAHHEFPGVTEVKDGTVRAEQKFRVKEGADMAFEPGETVKLSDIVELTEFGIAKLTQAFLYAAASPATENDTVSVTYYQDVTDWKNNTITFSEDSCGLAKLVITDYFYCEPTVIYLNVSVAEPVEKFQATATSNVDAEKAVTLDQLFAALPDVRISNAGVDLTVTGGTYEFVKNEADWTQSTVTFAETATYTLIITDADNCVSTERTVTVDAIDKFALVFENTDKYLYRVGNADGSTVALNLLFESLEGVTVSSAEIEFETVAGNARGTYTPNATWSKGTIQFTGTGVVKVIITTTNANPLTLNLEVVEAVNVTSATSATANNVVLLKDCGFSSLEVSNGYALYGNGFTMTCASDSVASDMGYAFVTLTDGTLDNVQIDCPNFDYAALYKSNLTSSDNRSETDSSGKTRYYNAKSGVMVSGNSQILNSRISGARAAVNVSNGNCVIDNSRIELGAVASVLVGAANSLTLRDVTLVQRPTAATYDSSKTLMGFSVLVMCTEGGVAAPITLEGTLIQNAWVDESDKNYVPEDAQGIISTVMEKTEYLHDIDEDGVNESLNLGIAYMPADGERTVSQPTITDNRSNKDAIPYDYVEVGYSLVTTYVYSYKNTNGTDDSTKENGEYTPNTQSDIITVTYSDTADGLTTGKSYGTDGWVYELNVDMDKLPDYTLDFSILSMSVNGVAVTDFNVDGNAKPTEPVAVTTGGTTYTLTATVNDKEYTAAFKVTGTETSKESPSLVASNYEAGLCVASSYGGTWHGAAPVLEGIQIKYWSVAEKQYKTITLSDYTPTTAGKQNGTNAEWTYSPDNGDFTLTIKNETAVHSGNSVYAMPVVCDSKLYFVASSSNGLVNSGNTARTIKINYYFNDNNGGEQLSWNYTWSVEENKDAQYKYSDFCDGTMTKLENCIVEGTMITLADGTQKPVEELTGEEMLLVWNLETGRYDAAPIVFVDSDAETEYEVIRLVFSDGTDVEIIYEHGFFDVTTGEYVYLDADNAESYIGHRFIKQGDLAQNTWDTVELVDVIIERKVTTAYSPVTFSHLCYYVDGMLSMPGGIEGLFNIFEVDTDTMSYNAEKMAADIETYGLFTYEDFAALIPEEAFYAFNGAWLKVAMGKGMLTWEDIEYMANRYVPLM